MDFHTINTARIYAKLYKQWLIQIGLPTSREMTAISPGAMLTELGKKANIDINSMKEIAKP